MLKCNPTGVLHMECRERYFMIAVDLSFTGEELRFEAVGRYETNGFVFTAIKGGFFMINYLRNLFVILQLYCV